MKFLSSRGVVVGLAILLLQVVYLLCLKKGSLDLSEKFSIYQSAYGKLGYMCATHPP